MPKSTFPVQSTFIKKLEPKKETLKQKQRTVEQRWLWEFNLLKNPTTGKIPKGIRAKELAVAKQTPIFGLEKNDANITITARGPNNLGGRTRAIAFDTRSASIILAGGVSSGVFRSANGGSSWTKVSPNGEIHNVTTIAQDTRTGQEDTWYYGTGERSGNSASLGSTYLGHGIWKSTDNGLSWSALSATQGSLPSFDVVFDYVHRIVVDPTNGDVYAAAGNSIKKSTDGGTSWSTALGSANTHDYTDIAVTTTGRLYAAFQGSDGSEGVHTSTDGSSWTKIAGGSSSPNHANWNAAGTYGRIVLAIAPSNENLVYALYYNNTTSSCTGSAAPEAELFMWDNSSSTWTDKSANLPNESGCSDGNDPFACQGGYDLCVAVKPNDTNTVFIGGTNAYRSTDAFTSTSNTTRIGGYASAANYAKYTNHHPDIHFFAFAPGNNNILYTGTDGGIASGDITATPVVWSSLNNDYVTYQYYHVDILPTSGSSVVIGGLQDNGTTESASGTSHNESFGGDGGAVGAISYTSSSNYNIIGSTQNGSLFRFVANGGFGWTIRPAGTSSSIFVTYFHLDQDNTNYLYYADGQNLYRTRIASSISATTVTGNPSTGWELMTGIGGALTSNIRSMATSRNDAHSGSSYSSSDASRRLYIGTANGKVYRLDDPAFGSAATAPTDITPSAASSGIVSGIATKPDAQNEILVTYSNFGINSVFHTTDANNASPTWSNVEGNISLFSFRSAMIVTGNAKTLYFVGTSTGLYCTSTLNAGSTIWSIVGSSSIAYALCSSMRYRPADKNLLVGTHGNGMFQLDVSNAILPVELLTFKGKAEERGNMLKWTTASEVNNDYFLLEHSTDGFFFDELIHVPGSLNSFEELNYSFLHQTPRSGVNYYRLSQKDLDGAWHDLGVRAVEREANTDFAIEPNPISEDLIFKLEYPSDMDGKIYIYSLNGQLVFSKKVFIHTGINLYQYRMTSIPDGSYFLHIRIGRKQFTERFVKY